MASPIRFAHRSNPNGTTDSICKQCFLTIGTASQKADLGAAEEAHKCEPWRLESLKRPVQRAAEGEGWTRLLRKFQ